MIEREKLIKQMKKGEWDLDHPIKQKLKCLCVFNKVVVAVCFNVLIIQL